jgi:hypothetical protein
LVSQFIGDDHSDAVLEREVRLRSQATTVFLCAAVPGKRRDQMNVDQHLGKADICPQFGSRKPRNNSEITTAEQRDNSTGAPIKKQQRGRNIPGPGVDEFKMSSYIAAQLRPPAWLRRESRRSGLQCAPLVSQRSGFVK